jgi:hypothetical protein
MFVTYRNSHIDDTFLLPGILVLYALNSIIKIFTVSTTKICVINSKKKTNLVRFVTHLGYRVRVLIPLSTIFQFILAVSFIGGGDQRTRRKPPNCRKSLTNFIT